MGAEQDKGKGPSAAEQIAMALVHAKTTPDKAAKMLRNTAEIDLSTLFRDIINISPELSFGHTIEEKPKDYSCIFPIVNSSGNICGYERHMPNRDLFVLAFGDGTSDYSPPSFGERVSLPFNRYVQTLQTGDNNAVINLTPPNEIKLKEGMWMLVGEQEIKTDELGNAMSSSVTTRIVVPDDQEEEWVF